MKVIIDEIIEDYRFLIKWLLISIVLGSICGVIGACFHHCIDFVVEMRNENIMFLYLMPIGGLVIIYLYRLVKFDLEPNTNTVIQTVRQKDEVPQLLAPAIFCATVITQLVGGSSGREGAALQIGGSIATSMGKIIKANEKDMSILVMCGMTAVFSALFGTPLTATIFSMEIISVGTLYYSAFLPCLSCGFIAYLTAQLLGCHSVHYKLTEVITIEPQALIRLLLLAVILSFVSILFVLVMHKTHHFFKKYFKNPYIRIFVGSLFLILLVQIFGKNYLGAGMEYVDKALYEEVLPYDFLLKIIFTAITIGCGFKGGEIVPTFFIGATLGFTVSSLIGIEPQLGAAFGMVGMFCCVVNAPIASIVLGIEVFGSQNLLPMAFVVVLCYLLSGYTSLYHAQKFAYSKTALTFVDKEAL